MTIGVAPTFDLAGIEFAWHGVMTALGIATGYALAWSLAPRFRVSRAVLDPLVIVLAVSGIIGARLWYLVENDPLNLLTPWAGGREGFSFWGAVIVSAPAAAIYLRRRGGPVGPYLDLVAIGFLGGMAVGRVADLLNGEHYGPPTGLPWGVAYSNPAAQVPAVDVSYQSGALYEILAAMGLLGVALVLARRTSTPGRLFWTLLIGYALSRFLIFFVVRDADVVALGLRQAQWTSLAVLCVAGAGIARSMRRLHPPGGHATAAEG